MAAAPDVEVREVPIGQAGTVHRVMSTLREHLADDVEAFTHRVDAVQRTQGYRLLGAYPEGDDGAEAIGVAGFRQLTTLGWGSVLYVDDLATLPKYQGQGVGLTLLDALESQARHLGCDALHLDSAHHRYPAHRFYLGNGFQIRSHHFVKQLD